MDAHLNEGKLGEFWLPSNPNVRRPGIVRWRPGNSPSVELSGQLTPAWTPLGPPNEDGAQSYQLTDDRSTQHVVHGTLHDGTQISLLQAYSSARAFSLLGDASDGSESFGGIFLLLGGVHVDLQSAYHRSRVWADFLTDVVGPWFQPGLTLNAVRASSIRSGHPMSASSGDLRLTVETARSRITETRSATEISQVGCLVAEVEGSLTLREWEQRQVTPLTNFLAAVAFSSSDVNEWTVETEEGDILSILTSTHTPATRPSAHHQFLVPLRNVGLENLAAWMMQPTALQRIAAIATHFANGGSAIDGQALTLSTVVETAYRELFPEAPSLDEAGLATFLDDVEQLGATHGAELADRARRILSGSLRMTPYNTMLRALADHLDRPDLAITGQTEKWISLVNKVRHPLAHGNPPELEDSVVDTWLVAAMSIRWLLLVCILQLADLPSDIIADGLRMHGNFSSFVANAQAWAPEIYAAESS